MEWRQNNSSCFPFMVEYLHTDVSDMLRCFMSALNVSHPTVCHVVLKECRGGVSAGELFRWIWEADFYFIIGHIHQGLKHMNVEELWDKISMLASHTGFPAGLNLRCPVFIQDKFV